MESSDVQLGPLQPGNERRVIHVDRSARSTIYRRSCSPVARANWRTTHHHRSRGLIMLRGFFVIFLLSAIAVIAVFGFRGQKSTQPPTEVFPDMVRQPKVRAQAPLDLFADGRGPRLPVPGTVPIGYEMPKPQSAETQAIDVGSWSHPHSSFSVGTDYYNTGKMADQWGTGIPLEVTRELMERGQQRFNITCAMCHGAAAAGNGITKQYGLATVVSLKDERIRKMSEGVFFNNIPNGKETKMA